MKAQFIGVGVGPGDPELLTLKALRLIQNADVVSYLEGESEGKKVNLNQKRLRLMPWQLHQRNNALFQLSCQ